MQATESTLPLTVNPFEALVNANAASAAAKVTKKAKAKAKEAVDNSKKDAEVTAKQSNPDSKRARAVIIYKESIGDGKKVVIERFKKELSMTDAGSNSYFYATKKALSQ